MKQLKQRIFKRLKRLKRLHERWELRSVKHLTLHQILNIFVPACVTYFAALSGGDHLTGNMPAYLAFPVMAFVGWWLLVILFGFADQQRHKYECLHVEAINTDDMGEDPILGNPWRRAKTTFAISRGLGRLQRTHMEWVEFGVNMQTGEMRPIEASDPTAHEALIQQFENRDAN